MKRQRPLQDGQVTLAASYTVGGDTANVRFDLDGDGRHIVYGEARRRVGDRYNFQEAFEIALGRALFSAAQILLDRNGRSLKGHEQHAHVGQDSDQLTVA